MLQYLIPVLQNLAAICIPLALLFALTGQRPGEKVTKWFWRGVVFGSAGALAVALMEWYTVWINRELYELGTQGVALVGEVLLLLYGWLGYRRRKLQTGGWLPSGVAFLVPAALLFYRGPDILLVPANGLVMATTWASSELWLQIAGYLLGMGLAVLAAVAVLRVAFPLPPVTVLGVATAGFLTVMAQHTVSVVQVMLVRGLVPMKKWLLAVMVPLINGLDWFFYALLVSTLILSVVLLLRRSAAVDPDLNPAKQRKIRATERNRRRWGAVVGTNLLCILLLTSVGKAYVDQKVELSPAVPVTAVQDEVRVPLTTAGDGHLHRFVYTASNGKPVRFIIIKKSGSAYGVGLDACDICGPTGYYEREGQVVCKLCDVVMNTATIGFTGGCNPVPLAHKVDGGNLVVPVTALEKEKERF
ncbi:Fe-S-containing protein [Sporomusa aerivorans]|uniref:Fe-S-containing protein n=1 Tax=Sporomusa aerivorans TaxID=204936 RepID=UPI00352B8D38